MLRRKVSVLFLCTANACRSQMAEGWARHLRPDAIEASSAGTRKHRVSESAIRVMAEAGVDISGHESKSLDELPSLDFDFVLTVCDRAAEACPVFPGDVTVIHRGFDDPPRLAVGETDPEQALEPYRRVRDEIKALVQRLPEALLAAQTAGHQTNAFDTGKDGHHGML